MAQYGEVTIVTEWKGFGNHNMYLKPAWSKR